MELDGTTVIEGALGIAFAIDPGDHVVVATAPGRVRWSAALAIEPAKPELVVRIPELLPAPPEAASGAPSVASRAIPLPPLAPLASSKPIWPWIAGGAGVVVGAIGLGFGIDQQSASGELDDRCGPNRATCPQGYDFDATRAREERDQAFFLGLGLVGLGGIGAGVFGLAFAGDASSDAASARSPHLEVGSSGARATLPF